MDKMYIPNTQKWIQYYQNLGKNGHNPYLHYSQRDRKQIGGGSLSGSPQQFITPVGPEHKSDHEEKVTVNLVSPVQQSIDQAKDEVKRNRQGIKRKRRDETVSPPKKRRRKQTQKVKKASKKTLRVTNLKKKVPKKTIKLLTKKTSRKQKKKKNTLKKKSKSTFNDIFS